MTPSSQMRRAAELPAMVCGADITASSVQRRTVRYEATYDGVRYRPSWRVVCSAVRCAKPPKLARETSLNCWLYEPGGV